MKPYREMSKEELASLKEQLEAVYKEYQGKNLSLNMARGKPCKEQLDLSLPMMDVLNSSSDYSDAQKEEILAILTKKEYGQFMDYVQTKDPNAFVTISNVKRVVGSWNTPKRRTYF